MGEKIDRARPGTEQRENIYEILARTADTTSVDMKKGETDRD